MPRTVEFGIAGVLDRSLAQNFGKGYSISILSTPVPGILQCAALIKETARRDGQNKEGLRKMKHRNFSFSALVMALTFGFVLAACGSKDPLEGKWTATVEGETVSLVFYGGQVGLDVLGNDMIPYIFEKNAGTIDTFFGAIPFTLDGKTIKMNVFETDLVFTKDTTPTPKALAGEWIADNGEGSLVFISDLIISSGEDGDAGLVSYTFADNQGEAEGVSFTVDGKTLTLAPEYEDYKMVFTLGGKK
jgi:hypothetical protein